MCKALFGKKKILSLLVLVLFVTFMMGSAAFANGTVAQAESPKYVFYFIGDGMASAHTTLAEFYTQFENKEEVTHSYEDMGESFIDHEAEEPGDRLTMHQLDVHGSTRTTGSDTIVPGSGQTATALATGIKTSRNAISVDPDGNPLETVLLAANKQGMNTGLISTARITHATPGAFGANVLDRSMENEIAVQYLENNIDFLAGGGYRHFLPQTVEGSSREDNRDLFREYEEAGYAVFRSAEDTQRFRDYQPSADSKILYTPNRTHMQYEIDRVDSEEPSLAELTEKGIEALTANDNGFIVMVEGGRIDHAAHNNDVAGTIYDTLAFDDSIAVALDFYEQYPDETLIIVVGDHETGGLSLNNCEGMEYDYFLDLEPVTRVQGSVEEGFAYTGDRDQLFADMENIFGIDDLKDFEIEMLENAMDLEDAEGVEADVADFGAYWPQAPWISPTQATIAHITSRRSKIGWSTSSHTGSTIPMSAHGVNAEYFNAALDNTDVGQLTAAILGLELDVEVPAL